MTHLTHLINGQVWVEMNDMNHLTHLINGQFWVEMNDMTHFNTVNIKQIVLVETNPTLNLLQEPFQPICHD